jgi:rSAM/selenodomain-associated transferase 2
MRQRPTFSIIIPVYREVDRIAGTIAHLRRLDHDKQCEIIVVDGDPNAATIRAVTDGGVACLRCAKSRARQMNAGAGMARGDILVFLHADTVLPRQALEKMKSVFENGTCIGGAFGLANNSDRWWFRVVGPITTIRSRVTRIPYGDQSIFLGREYFQKIGGYSDIPIMEDIELMRRIKRRGDRIAILGENVVTSARRLETEGFFFCAARAILLLALYKIGVSPRRLKRYYGDDHRPPATPSAIDCL